MDADDARPGRRAIDSRSDFVTALHEAIEQALARRARLMAWVDADFADWPLDDPALLQRLSDWLRLPGRRLQLLAADYEGARRHARFMACYRLWSHAISAHGPAQDDAAALPCLLLADDTCLVQLPDKARWRGWATTEPPELRAWRERTDALLQRSAPAFAVTTLGL
jgi:hypothetical protein